MKTAEFHITLIGGERIFLCDDLNFGVMSDRAELVWYGDWISVLMNRDFNYICTYIIVDKKEVIQRIIPRSSILSFDRNVEKLTRKIILEKQKQ